MPDLSTFSMLTGVIIFLVAAALVWVAGTRLSGIADDFSEQTGVGRAFVGLLLLGGITSLPEMATTVTASIKGNAGMAVNNILGGVSMQVTILAVVDFWQQKKPISFLSTDITVIMQGVWLIIMLAFTAGCMLVEPFALFHIGISALFIFFIFLFGLYFIHRFSSFSWFVYSKGQTESLRAGIDDMEHRLNDLSNSSSTRDTAKDKEAVALYLKKKGVPLVLWSLLILVAGYFVITSSEIIAQKTGLSGNFTGLVLVAVTTSLPEVSTTLGAIKLKRFDMALSNIFGTNLFDVSLIFIADLFFIDGTVLEVQDSFSMAAAMLGIILTGIYLLGILAKSKKQLLGIGFESLVIIITYLAGILMLYFM